MQRLQSLIPTEEELKLIKEAKAQAPRCPLALAEQCLFTMGNVAHLSSRLQLWAFALDYDTLEKVRFPFLLYFSFWKICLSKVN